MARKIYVKTTEYVVIDSVYEPHDDPPIFTEPFEQLPPRRERLAKKIWRLAWAMLILAGILWAIGSVRDAKAEDPLDRARSWGAGRPPICAGPDWECIEAVRKKWGYTANDYNRPDPAPNRDNIQCEWPAGSFQSMCTRFDGNGIKPPVSTFCRKTSATTMICD